METLASAARGGGLVIFAGAGISMAPPSSLPNWWAINEAVLAALARRIAVFTDAAFSADVLQRLVATRNERAGFAPDYQAQMIEDECGLAYFRVLQAMDCTETNANHRSIARLAAAGHVAAIVTTNFDRLIETALAAELVPHEVFADHRAYATLGTGGDSGVVPVVKVHGSVERPESMVDTLRQRLMGRPEELERSLQSLLARHHMLFVGFSGADLAYDPNYLGLRGAAATQCGFTALQRTGEDPNPAMAALRDAWGDGARFVSGELPAWWHRLFAALQLAPATDAEPAAAPVDRMALIHAHADAWAGSLGHMLAVANLAELLDASGRHDIAYELLVRTYQRWCSERDAEAPGYARFHYQLARRLLEIGQFDHRFDSQRAREALRPGASTYTYNDCFQSIQRSLLDGQSADGHIAWGLYDTLRGRPQTGAERLRRVRDAALDQRGYRFFIDACRALALPYEILMHYADALDWLEQAYRLACRFGDEPRRAALCAELARFLAMKEGVAEAHEKVAEGLAIAQRLHLITTHIDLLAAGGGVFVVAGDGERAVQWLDPAIDALRKMSRRPALARALLDAGYAAHQLSSQPRFDAVYGELLDLVDTLPGYAPQAVLMLARVHRHRNVRESRRLCDVAKEFAEENENPGVAEEAALIEASLPPDDAAEAG